MDGGWRLPTRGARIGMRGGRMARGVRHPWRGRRRRPVAAGSRCGSSRRPLSPARKDEAGGWRVVRRVWGGPRRAPRRAWRVRPRAAARCGRAPGAGVAGGPSVHPVGPGPAHGPWRRAPHPPRGAQPGGGLCSPRRVRPGAFPARLTTACS